MDINTLHDRPSAQGEMKRYDNGKSYRMVKWIAELTLFRFETRISQLELLDELEEWRLLAAHYCVALAWKSSDDENLSEIKLVL